MKPTVIEKERKVKVQIEQCGYCGRFFKGNEYLENFKPSGDIPLEYCPEAQMEDYQQNGTNTDRVTRDMAIDAGDPSLEGQII